VVTFPCAEAIEAVGINTPGELRRIEHHLQRADTRDVDGEEDITEADG
jgi:hypothetical protein